MAAARRDAAGARAGAANSVAPRAAGDRVRRRRQAGLAQLRAAFGEYRVTVHGPFKDWTFRLDATRNGKAQPR